MDRRPCSCLFVLLLLAPAAPVRGQALTDTLFTWEGYARNGTCGLRIYAAPPDADRAHTVVLRELADNRGPATTADARYLAELIGRRFGLDPAAVTWVFHWGAFSYTDAPPDRRKELFLRATFRRTATQGLGTPSWRVVTREDVETYTDRLFR